MIHNLKEITIDAEIGNEHVPSVQLGRFFEKQEHLNDFCSNNFRFVNLSHYKMLEDNARSDSTELESMNQTVNGVHYSSFSNGFYYAMCFSENNCDTEIGDLRQRFGADGNLALYKRILDNLELTNKIISTVSHQFKKQIAYFRWFRVEYNKNEIVEAAPEYNDRHIYQKPRSHITYKLERIKKSTCPDICIDIGGNVGTVSSFSSLNEIAMIDYISRIESGDWVEVSKSEHNYEIEREWRLVFWTNSKLDEDAGGAVFFKPS